MLTQKERNHGWTQINTDKRMPASRYNRGHTENMKTAVSVPDDCSVWPMPPPAVFVCRGVNCTPRQFRSSGGEPDSNRNRGRDHGQNRLPHRCESTTAVSPAESLLPRAAITTGSQTDGGPVALFDMALLPGLGVPAKRRHECRRGRLRVRATTLRSVL
jgi:hypothetical protein